MAIVPLVRVTLCGPAAERLAVLDGLQNLGCIHLSDLRPHDAAAAVEPAYPAVREALQYLRDSPVRRRALRQRNGVDLEVVAKQALEVRDRTRSLVEERAQLHKWIADNEPWGDFELPEWAKDGALRFWFYIVPHRLMPRFGAVALPWKVVGRDHRFAYVVVVACDRPTGLPVPPVPLEPRPLAKLHERLKEVECELDELDYRRIGLTLHTDLLREVLDEADDRAAQQRAVARTLERDQLFAVQGWAPVNQAPLLRQFGAEHRLALTIEPPRPADKPPTLLHNPPALRGGEQLVEFYRTPAYRLWDPSQTTFFAFAAFFAMIISDAGYALLLGLLLLGMWRSMGRTAAGRALREVMLALAGFSIIYGVLIGTYFGVEPPAGSWLASLHLLDANDQRLMMWIAIGVGASHLVYANLVAAWLRRHSPTALHSLGWAAIISGGFCLVLGRAFPRLASLGSIGAVALPLGALLVLLFTSERPFQRSLTQWFGRLVDGLKGLTEVSKAFGDVLSYLRLFALGMASIKLAQAFNGLAATSSALGAVGVLLAGLVLLVGHSINLAMGIMSGLVHGLRLNVIEFFNWSLPEEGERFQAFEKKVVKASH
jgi:V/A-type H+/Na+-transporting ATPase subunit I